MLSNPHCASTSAENPDGIASHPLTTALPDFQISLTLFVIFNPSCLRLFTNSGLVVAARSAAHQRDELKRDALTTTMIHTEAF
jgi:hypothetical protein